MPIQFSCTCGRLLRVADGNAGKQARCPGCGKLRRVPDPAEEDVEENLEVVEDDPAEDNEPAPTAAKKRRKRPPAREESWITQMYTAEASEDIERDAARIRAKRARGRWGRDAEGGRTFLGVHVTAGVWAGASMVVGGLGTIITFYLFREQWGIGPKEFGFAVMGTAVGIVLLIKSLEFGDA